MKKIFIFIFLINSTVVLSQNKKSLNITASGIFSKISIPSRDFTVDSEVWDFSYSFDLSFSKSLSQSNKLFAKSGISFIRYSNKYLMENEELYTWNGNVLVSNEKITKFEEIYSNKYFMVFGGLRYFFLNNKIKVFSEISLGLLFYVGSYEFYYFKIENHDEKTSSKSFFDSNVNRYALNSCAAIGWQIPVSDKFSIETNVSYCRMLTPVRNLKPNSFFNAVGLGIGLDYSF